jgi:hypothetical protein
MRVGQTESKPMSDTPKILTDEELIGWGKSARNNPEDRLHVIRKLEDHIQAQRELLEKAKAALENYASCCDGCNCGDGFSHNPAREVLNELNKALE